jgi:UDP-3-O-[3-hydroxymyristoyl] glucosamine N-acyltransferase
MDAELFRPTAFQLPTPEQVAQWTGGELRDVVDLKGQLAGLSTLAEARPGEIAFVASPKALRQAGESQASLFIVSAEAVLPGRPCVVVDQVWSAVAAVMQRLYPEPEPSGQVHPTAVLGLGVRLGDGVTIGPYCVVGDDCSIGDGAILGPHCILGDGCRVGRDCRLVARVTLVGAVIVGDRVLIHPGAVLGADGFKFELVGGRALKIPQVGAVIIEDEVEIGANTTIDRAFLYETRVGRGTKIDNLCQIAHNVQIGPSCMMAAQVGIAGSTRMGAGCLMGGASGLADNITIGNRVSIGGGSKVHGDHPDGETLIGYPAVDLREFAKISAAQRHLPELLKRVRALEKKAEAGTP